MRRNFSVFITVVITLLALTVRGNAQTRATIGAQMSGSATASANAATMAYSTSATYHVGDLVSYNGGTYISLVLCTSVPCASPTAAPGNWQANGEFTGGTVTNPLTAPSVSTDGAYNGGQVISQYATPTLPPAPPANSIIFPTVANSFSSASGVEFAFTNLPTAGATMLSCGVPTSTAVSGGTALVSLCSFVAGGAADAPLSFVSYTGGTNGATSSATVASNENSASTGSTFSLASGNSLLVSVSLGTTATISSVAELGGCTFTQIGSTQTMTGPTYHYWYLANNCATAEASDVVTVTASAAGTYNSVQVYQIANGGTALALDVQPAAANATGTSVTTASFNTTKASDVVACDGWVVGEAYQLNAGSGYTRPGSVGGNGAVWESAEYQLFTTTQSGITASFGYSSSQSMDIACVAVGH